MFEAFFIDLRHPLFPLLTAITITVFSVLKQQQIHSAGFTHHLIRSRLDRQHVDTKCLYL